MIDNRLSFSLLLFTHLQALALTLAIPLPTLNISRYIYPRIGHELRPQPSPFLQDVLNAISERQKWNPEDVQVSKLDTKEAKFGNSLRYEVRFRVGKSEAISQFGDEVSSWKELKEGGDFETIVKQVSSEAVLHKLKLEGPFELRVDGDDELSLLLRLNKTRTGLKRILVGEGITVEVNGAREVSLLHASKFGSQLNKSVTINTEKSSYWSVGHSLCMPLLPIHILGSSSIVAYMTGEPNSFPKMALLSSEVMELLPDKCYSRYTRKKQKCPIVSLRSRVAMLENILRGLPGHKTSQSEYASFPKAKIKALAIILFQLEVQRNIRSNEDLQGTLAEWRTRPTVERVLYEVAAKNEGDRLKPLAIKKVRPFIAVDSSALSNLMSNISFTKFPSLLVPPEALTLDVKW